MNTNGLAAVMDRFTSDDDFRHEMESDPQGAIQRGGFQLDDAEWETIRNLDWNVPGENLDDRISKIGIGLSATG